MKPTPPLEEAACFFRAGVEFLTLQPFVEKPTLRDFSETTSVAGVVTVSRFHPGAAHAASIAALAAFKVARVSRAILPFAIKLRILAFRVVVE